VAEVKRAAAVRTLERLVEALASGGEVSRARQMRMVVGM
jgi:hypothetical protein